MNRQDFTLLSVTFNNNVLTGMMIKSFVKQVGIYPNVVIVDNGTTIPADEMMKRVFTVIDNFNHKLLPDERQPSRNHCAAIDYALYNCIHTKWCLLVDNDILFKPEMKELIKSVDETKYDAYGEVGWDCTPPDRLYPYMCIFNVDKLRSEGIKYFDPNRTIKYKTLASDGSVLFTDEQYNQMDTGYSFYEDIKATWRINKFPINNVCIHLKSGMLANKPIESWLMQNKHLF
jgi:hypothetical protein